MSIHGWVHLTTFIVGFGFAFVMNYALELGQGIREVLWCGIFWSGLSWVHYLMGLYLASGSAFRHLFGF